MENLCSGQMSLALALEIPWTLPKDTYVKAPGETRAQGQGSYSARVFRVSLGQPSYPCIWPHPLIPRRSWIPTSFSPIGPANSFPELQSGSTCMRKWYSGPLKSVPRLFLTFPTSWLRLCTALERPEASPILPPKSLAGAASHSLLPDELLGLKSHFYFWKPLILIVCTTHRTISGRMLK